jgi:malic enzyme
MASFISDADETLFYAILVKHTFEVMPFVYTPTVGQACQEWGYVTKGPRHSSSQLDSSFLLLT